MSDLNFWIITLIEYNMAQCLVTRLKESVADSSLHKIGEKAFTLLAGKSVTLAGEGVQLRGINGNFDVKNQATNVRSYVLKPGFTYVTNTSSNDVIIGVSELEKLSTIAVEYPRPLSVEIDLSFFAKSNKMGEITLANQTILGGTLADLANTKASTINLSTTMASGNIVDIASLNYAVGDAPRVSNCPNVFGEIIDFVKARRKVGRTADSISNAAWFVGTGMTFNGESVGYTEGTLSWTENTITFRGVTINA